MRSSDDSVEAIRGLERQFLPPAPPNHDHLVWAEARGSTILTLDGREVIDFTSGVLITNVGHAHPHVTEAITRQAERGLNTFLAPHPLRASYAKRLVEALGDGFEQVAYLSSGAEAIDTAVRIARIATGRRTVIAFTDSYHGKTSSTAAYSGLASARPQGSEPVDHVRHVPYPDELRPPLGLARDEVTAGVVAHLRSIIEGCEGDVACIIFEPYLGSGGAIPAPAGFARELRAVADECGAKLIYDEVQSGFRRTGPLFAFQGDGVRPDLVVLAKGIASGVPMAVVAGPGELISAPRPGTLWNSYGGGPLACAAAHATLDLLEDPAVGRRVDELANRLRRTVDAWAAPHVARIQGRGLSLGIDVISGDEALTPDPERARHMMVRAGECGVAVLGAAGAGRNVVRIAPPLLIADEEFELGLEALTAAAEGVLFS
jgi:4-aminobutyrate aminotransferase-like enzyme